ncbi:acyl-ACP--UDP-N-acetylglucosamine O-acyltransferase [Thermodesulfobacteriota bacterium]
MNIHPSAVVDPAAELDSTVQVGPFVVIEKGVRIGADTVVGPHTVISGPTTIGVGNKISPFVNLGAPPQDLHYQGEETTLEIGDHNIIREYVSLHRGTVSGRGVTSVGNHNMLMAYVHVAHDCQVGDHVIMANGATLGGHVTVEDRATLGGMVAVHQFSRIGEYAYIGGMSGLSKDVAPYVIAVGIRNGLRVTGVNKVGLKRAGFDLEDIKQLSRAYKVLFRSNDLILQDALLKVEAEFADCQPVLRMVKFFRDSKRGVVRTAGEDEL